MKLTETLTLIGLGLKGGSLIHSSVTEVNYYMAMVNI